jgi:hypothetical protein
MIDTQDVLLGGILGLILSLLVGPFKKLTGAGQPEEDGPDPIEKVEATVKAHMSEAACM